jgi:hypothetical protein
LTFALRISGYGGSECQIHSIGQPTHRVNPIVQA